MISFQNFKQIQELQTNEEKHRVWLKDYEGLYFSIGKNEKDLILWSKNKEKYIYSDKLWKDWYCEDFYGIYLYAKDINKIQRNPQRLVIEFDGKKPKEDLEQVYKKLKKLKIGFIRSSHKGKCDYLWVEFTRALTTKEAKNYLELICPKGATIDMNFTSDYKRFPVLFSKHWKYNTLEEPKEYFKGEQIDYDLLFKTEKPEGYETLTKETETLTKQEQGFKVRTIRDFKNLKVDKGYIVQNFLYPKTLNMFYSPPKSFKSLVMMNLAFSIANGKEWLKLKCKKNPVLLCDGENNDRTKKERFEKTHKGLNLKRYSYPFYELRGFILLDDKKRVHLGNYERLKEVIEEFKIKVLIFDTLHRFAFYDENKADDINKLYTQILKPLIEDFNISIIFLHHTTKAGDYRGSGDFMGIVDNAFRILRYGKTDKFKMINENCRVSSEIPDIIAEIDFGEEYIKIIRGNEEKELEKKISKLKEVTNKVKELFKEGVKLRKKDIEDKWEIEDYDYSISTLKRSLNYLVENNILDKDNVGDYTLILR